MGMISHVLATQDVSMAAMLLANLFNLSELKSPIGRRDLGQILTALLRMTRMFPDMVDRVTEMVSYVDFIYYTHESHRKTCSPLCL